MPNLVYSVADFQPFTVIRSSEVNAKFNDIKTLLNTTKLDDTNLQDNGITRATKLKMGTADHVIINNGSGAMSSEAQLATTRGGLGFNPSFTNNAGKPVVVKTTEDGFELGTASTDIIVESLAAHEPTLTAGEAISVRDAVCLDFNEGAYKVFRCDSNSTSVRKSNFIGFARAAATVTPQISTYTLDAAFVTGNSIETLVNGRAYVVPFNSTSDETLQDVADALVTDPEILTALVTVVGGNQTGSDDRVITFTCTGGVTVNVSATVTGGASQPNIAVANTQNPSGQNVQIQAYGPLGGFSSLTVGDIYYVDSVAGQITNAPVDTAPQRVGQAISTSVLFINRFVDGYAFPSSALFYATHGATTFSAADATADVEQFNLASWSMGTSAPSARWCAQTAFGILANNLYYVDGADTGNVVQATTSKFNKTSWSSPATRTTPLGLGGMAVLGSNLVVSKGTAAFATGTNALDTFNGTSWTNGAGTYAANGVTVTSFTEGGFVRTVGGSGTQHETWNGSSVGSSTAYPASEYASVGGSLTSSGLAGADAASGTNSYSWNGSTWSSAITIPYVINASGGAQSGTASSGFLTSANKLLANGGNPSGSNATDSTASFNGTSWATETSSAGSHTSGSGGAF